VSAPGTLFVVATPIGNRGDLSVRAREQLADVDLIAAEDTRHTGAFLAQLGVSRPMLSLHEHNEADRIAELVTRLGSGARIALVSDAGTPLISDPGYRLVAAVASAGFNVVPIPGACAAIAALSVAGLPTDRFVFEGFLPSRGPKRRARLAELASEARTLVFYEAPHRIAEALEDLCAAFGESRMAVLARELTKMHESVYRGSLATLVAAAREDENMSRGEAVLVVAGAAAVQSERSAASELAERLLRALLPALPLSRAVDIVVDVTGERRNSVYPRALSLKASASPGPDDPAAGA
jgi:16S rRNA (cytidine1402-2'-O)-methyltransferase